MPYIGINTPSSTLCINTDQLIAIICDKKSDSIQFLTTSAVQPKLEIDTDGKELYNSIAEKLEVGSVPEPEDDVFNE